MKLEMILICCFALVASARAEIVTKTVEYDVGGVHCKGFVAYDDAAKIKQPGVLVVHEWWGLNEFIREKARALAEMGYVAFAADMYGEGKVTSDPAQAQKWSGEARPKLRERARAALDVLARQERIDPERLAAIGFCFGGTTVLELAYSGADLKGVVSFHGGLSAPGAQDTQIKPEVLIVHGAADTTVKPEQISKTQDGLTKAGAVWTMVVYSGAKHAFTNPAADRAGMAAVGYNERAAKNSWDQMKLFFSEVLK